MKATEINIKLALKPGEEMTNAINRIISCMKLGHYQGKTVSKTIFYKNGYNFSFCKELNISSLTEPVTKTQRGTRPGLFFLSQLKSLIPS